MEIIELDVDKYHSPGARCLKAEVRGNLMLLLYDTGNEALYELECKELSDPSRLETARSYIVSSVLKPEIDLEKRLFEQLKLP